MIGLLIFLSGVVWTVIGLEVVSAVDPEGQMDRLVFGEPNAPSIIRFGLALLFWPATVMMIQARRNRP